MFRTQVMLALALLTALAANAAQAQEADPTIDTDNDGEYSFVELVVAFSGMTEELFVAIDSNADGVINLTEAANAKAVGMLPLTDG